MTPKKIYETPNSDFDDSDEPSSAGGSYSTLEAKETTVIPDVVNFDSSSEEELLKMGLVEKTKLGQIYWSESQKGESQKIRRKASFANVPGRFEALKYSATSEDAGIHNPSISEAEPQNQNLSHNEGQNPFNSIPSESDRTIQKLTSNQKLRPYRIHAAPTHEAAESEDRPATEVIQNENTSNSDVQVGSTELLEREIEELKRTINGNKSGEDEKNVDFQRDDDDSDEQLRQTVDDQGKSLKGLNIRPIHNSEVKSVASQVSEFQNQPHPETPSPVEAVDAQQVQEVPSRPIQNVTEAIPASQTVVQQVNQAPLLPAMPRIPTFAEMFPGFNIPGMENLFGGQQQAQGGLAGQNQAGPGPFQPIPAVQQQVASADQPGQTEPGSPVQPNPAGPDSTVQPNQPGPAGLTLPGQQNPANPVQPAFNPLPSALPFPQQVQQVPALTFAPPQPLPTAAPNNGLPYLSGAYGNPPRTHLDNFPLRNDPHFQNMFQNFRSAVINAHPNQDADVHIFDFTNDPHHITY